MIHTYTITGMTCDSCRTNVEKALNNIEGVQAIVTIEPPLATITMKKHISTEQLQKAITTVGDYTIKMSNLPPANPIASKEKESVEQHSEDPKNINTLYTCPMHSEVIKEQHDIAVSKY